MDPSLVTPLEVLVLVFMGIGLVGLVVPLIPGLVIIWLAALGYGVAVGFNLVGWLIIALITILMVVGEVVDNVFIGAKARQEGASWLSIGIGVVAGVVGILLFPPFGGILAAFLAIFLFELARQKDWRKALQLTKGMAIGCGWAFFVRFGIGVLMIGLWVLWVFIR